MCNVIYTRFSPRPNAEECDSCEKQYERCLGYLIEREYSTDEILYFSDKGVSGDERNRPGLDGMLEAIKPGCVVVVDKSSRLARDVFLNLKIRYEIRKRQGNLEYADGTPPATTPEGKFYQNILAAVDGLQLDLIRLNTKRGIARNRALGKKTNGRIPTGMMEDPDNPGMLVKYYRERDAILQICRWKALCPRMTTGEMAAELDNKAGIWLYRGKPWSPRLVRKIIARHSSWADPVDGDPEKEPEFF